MIAWLFIFWAFCLAGVVSAAPSGEPVQLSVSNSTPSIGTGLFNKSFVWSALGDTWASGVSYDILGRTDYDGNKDKCLRINHAYAVQLSEDDSWVPNGQAQDFHFQACSGTTFEEIDRVKYQGHIQLNDIPRDTDMLLLQVGGNNANFAAIAYACLFAPEGQEWGPAFPDPQGACAIKLAKAREYIYGTGASQLLQNTRSTVNAIFDNEKVKDNKNFRLFVLGYFQAFYEDGGPGDWCDDVSFALRHSNGPTLNLALRKEINELVRGLNDGIKAGVAGTSHIDHAHFIDIDSQIGDHRFCQPGHTLYDQYFGDEVYLWNMSPEGVILKSSKSNNGSVAYEVREPTPEEFEHWRKTGSFTDDPKEVHTNQASHNDLGPSQHDIPGIALRALHPKESGHTAMAQAVFKSLQRTYGAQPFAVGSVQDVPMTRSIQILLREYAGKFSWFVFVGPFGKAVDPCRFEDFSLVVWNYAETRPNLSLMTPPYVGYGTRWNFNFKGQTDCRFEAGKDDAGALKCGEYLDYPFEHDARYYNSVIINCRGRAKNLGSFHRAWTLELNI